jgi:hypothetical protein
VEAQPAQLVSIDLSQQAQKNIPNDEIGQTSSNGQMRTTTMAMRIAAALHLNLQRSGSSATYAGINPDTSQYSPLVKVGGVPGKMVEALTSPDYFELANWANSPLPQLDQTTFLPVPGTGNRKFIDTLPGICCQSGVTNSLGQCIPVGIPDTTIFPNSDYYEIALVEYR